MSSSSLPESGACAASCVCPCQVVPSQCRTLFHSKQCDQVQAVDENVQQLETITAEQFLEYLDVSGDIYNQNLVSPHGLSMDGFYSLANDIAQSIKATHFPNDDNLLVFKDTGSKIPNGHVTGTKCRPDITAAFEKDITDSMDWALIRLVGEKASKGKLLETQKKNAATYLHYLLLARPDFLVAQGLLTTTSGIIFFLGIGGVGIRQLEVDWGDKNLYKLLYVFIYRLYDPSHFADPSYTRTGFNEETSEVTYTVHINGKECPNLRTIHARNPFMTRTHVLSNPSPTKGDVKPTVIKDQYCHTGRRFDEQTILTKIHQPKNVPGVVEVVDGEIIATPLSPEREKHRLGLRQTGSPFTTICTAKKILETSFDLLEVLRFLRLERRILHRDISVGNIMYIENPEISVPNAVEPLVFAKHLLKESEDPQETSLLLVDFNLGEDLEDKKYDKRMERMGTPIFISRAVERGNTVPAYTMFLVPEVPKSPECYTNAHPTRIDDFRKTEEFIVDPRRHNQSQDNMWRHELDHDVESVFWLLLYWAMVAQPEGGRKGCNNSPTWMALLGNVKDRERLVLGFSSGDCPDNLTHSVYEPLWPLIRELAAILVVDRHWLPESDVRKRPEYICEAFQRLILQFIAENRNEDFMTCRVGDSLHEVQKMAESDALATTLSQHRDGLERENEAKRRHLEFDRTEGDDDNESSRMIE